VGVRCCRGENPDRAGEGQPRPGFEVSSVKPVGISKLGNAISMNIGTVRREEVRGAAGASREQRQAMMQTLLIERFKLVTHRERQEMAGPVEILVVEGAEKVRTEN